MQEIMVVLLSTLSRTFGQNPRNLSMHAVSRAAGATIFGALRLVRNSRRYYPFYYAFW
jgi:hypothetical protein